MRSLGVQKGIFISTSGFQSGAVKYAKEHGITLLQIFDKHVMHIQDSVSIRTELMEKMDRELVFNLPQYYAYEWDEFDFPSVRVYPAKQYVKMKQKEIFDRYKDEIE